MASDDYELMSTKQIKELKEQLKKIKDGGISPDKNLQVVMERLQKTMLELISLFREASQEMREDTSEESVHKKLEELSTKFDILIDQNEKIAEGIVTVADLIREQPQQEVTAQPQDRFMPSSFAPPEQQSPPPLQPEPQQSPQPAGPPPSPPPRPTQRRPFPNF